MPVTHAGEQSAPPGERGAVPLTATRGRQASTESNAGRSAGRCVPAGEAGRLLAAAAPGVPRGFGCELKQVVRYGVCKGMDGAGAALLLALLKPSTSAAFWMRDPGRVTSLWGASVTAPRKQW